VPLVTNFTLFGCGSTTCVGTGGGFGMMLRRGTGGFYANGLIARFPNAGVSMRDAETYARGGSVAVPDFTTSDLQLRNIYFTEVNSTLFQGANGTNVQNSLDATGNSLSNGTTALTSVLTTVPAAGVAPTSVAGLDWTPLATAPAQVLTGGLAAFTGKMLTMGGTAYTGTSYLGAASSTGTKWWSGWTVYFRN